MTILKNDRLRIAIQKSGRLSEKTFGLFEQCGLEFDRKKEGFLLTSSTFPVEVMLVRDDDIPEYVNDAVCDLGIVGRNIIAEKLPPNTLTELRPLGFGYCRLAIAAESRTEIFNINDLEGKRIATSYPVILARFLRSYDIKSSIITIAGSVEIAPSLDIADAVCDLVSTGETLRANGLKEVFTLLESQAVLVRKPKGSTQQKEDIVFHLLQRMDAVIKAQRTKYVMMNAPEERIEEIKKLIPGMEEPTIVQLTKPGKVAIHAVAKEHVFWETMERLKQLGATSILVVPIEKIID